MRATDGLQTTINLGPVHRDDRGLLAALSLGMSLPVPSRTSTSPTRSKKKHASERVALFLTLAVVASRQARYLGFFLPCCG